MKLGTKNSKLYRIAIVYWIMVIYIITGFVWWFISLESQNRQMFRFRVEELQMDDPYLIDKLSALKEAKNRKTMGYIGEGVSFMIVISAGAIYVYRAMRSEVKTSIQQQNFMMAITHELKTPISITRLNVETIKKRTLNPQQKERLLSQTLDEIERLNILTNNILVASQLESASYHLNVQKINLSEVAEDCVAKFGIRYNDRTIQLNIENNVYINGEEQMLALVINNLLDNARKYTPPTRSLEMELLVRNKQAILHVKDQGDGIPDEEKKQIFSRFYRLGSESTRKTKGTGLGLFLCKKIIKDLKGTICVKDNTPTGAIFTITLPLYKEA